MAAPSVAVMDDLPALEEDDALVAAQVDRTPWRRRHHPWRAFGLLDEWKLKWVDDLPDGRWGLTLHAEKVVLIADHLDEAERRCTIAHETQHALRGPVASGRHAYMREELLVNRRVGRLLLPDVENIGHALAWHHADHERTAWELWVDDETLEVRLSSLSARERSDLDDRLAHVWL